MRAAITGYRGFIGKRLLSLCELSIGIGDGYTKEELYRSLNEFKPNVVFHIGACSDTLNTDVNYVLETNYIKTKWIADWCYSNNVKLIYASSAAIYGTDKNLPSNLYGWS
jgi:ADP-L-glycero-D-manno-heptose 6-epimerase